MDDVGERVDEDDLSDFAVVCWNVFILAADAFFWAYVLHLIGVL